MIFRSRICLSLPTLIKTSIRLTSPEKTQLFEQDGFNKFVLDWWDFLAYNWALDFEFSGWGGWWWEPLRLPVANAIFQWVFQWETCGEWDSISQAVFSLQWNLQRRSAGKLQIRSPYTPKLKKIRGREFLKNGDEGIEQTLFMIVLESFFGWRKYIFGCFSTSLWPPCGLFDTLNFQTLSAPGTPGSMHSRVAREYLASGAARAWIVYHSAVEQKLGTRSFWICSYSIFLSLGPFFSNVYLIFHCLKWHKVELTNQDFIEPNVLWSLGKTLEANHWKSFITNLYHIFLGKNSNQKQQPWYQHWCEWNFQLMVNWWFGSAGWKGLGFLGARTRKLQSPITNPKAPKFTIRLGFNLRPFCTKVPW